MGADVGLGNRTVSVWGIRAQLQENGEQRWAGLNWLSTGSSGGFRNRLSKTCCLQEGRDGGGQRRLLIIE
jgi:hypothetical protein